MEQEGIMREAGYVTAAEAAHAVGLKNVGTIHRRIVSGNLIGARAGYHWYVLVKSLLEAYADAPPLLARIRALGVEAKDPPPAAQNGASVAPRARKGGKARGRRAR